MLSSLNAYNLRKSYNILSGIDPTYIIFKSGQLKRSKQSSTRGNMWIVKKRSDYDFTGKNSTYHLSYP